MPARSPTAAHLLAGQAAEESAVQHLRAHGLTILLRNFRCRTGELDIVAETPDGVVVIAEVRLRASRRFGGGAASVDWRKQRRLLSATRHLLATHPALARRALRFDVLDLAPEAGRGHMVQWIRHAFSASPR
jgi:putative endonuclease